MIGNNSSVARLISNSSYCTKWFCIWSDCRDGPVGREFALHSEGRGSNPDRKQPKSFFKNCESHGPRNNLKTEFPYHRRCCTVISIYHSLIAMSTNILSFTGNGDVLIREKKMLKRSKTTKNDISKIRNNINVLAMIVVSENV